MNNDHVFCKYAMEPLPESRPYVFQVHYTEPKTAAHSCTLPNKRQMQNKNKTPTDQEVMPRGQGVDGLTLRSPARALGYIRHQTTAGSFHSITSSPKVKAKIVCKPSEFL